MNEVAISWMPIPVLAMELVRARLATTELVRATLFANIYNPDEALAVGFLDAVAPADQVLAEAKVEGGSARQLKDACRIARPSSASAARRSRTSRARSRPTCAA